MERSIGGVSVDGWVGIRMLGWVLWAFELPVCNEYAVLGIYVLSEINAHLYLIDGQP